MFDLVKSDLTRWYHYSGKTDKKATVFHILVNFINPRFTPTLFVRLSIWLYRIKLSPLAKIVSLLNAILFGMEFSLRCKVGRGLFLPHTFGSVIGAESIGENVIIYHGVTVGAKKLDINYESSMRPKIGNNVVIGAGAIILGGITIGDNAVIGANSVVVSSIEANSLVVSMQGRVTKKLEGPLYE